MTEIFMLSPDEERFSATVASDWPATRWRCSHPGLAVAHPQHLHATLSEALRCGGSQAFLDLPFGTDPYAGFPTALIQFLRSRVLEDESGRCIARAGRLAVSWNVDVVGRAGHAALAAERDAVWTVLRDTTRPAPLESLAGDPVSGRRIGEAALEAAKSGGLQLAPYDGGYVRYRINCSTHDGQ